MKTILALALAATTLTASAAFAEPGDHQLAPLSPTVMAPSPATSTSATATMHQPKKGADIYSALAPVNEGNDSVSR